LEVYLKEQNISLKKMILKQLQTNTAFLGTLDPSLFLPLFEETDRFLLREIAVISLALPFDQTNQAEQVLLRGWSRLLKMPDLTAELRTKLVAKLQQFDYQSLPELEVALQITLMQIRSFKELQTFYPCLIKMIKDPTFLLPQLLVLLERFIGKYPMSPLPEMLRIINDLGRQLPEIATEIPYLANITGESWMLTQLGESTQKSELYPNILRLIDTCHFSEAVHLIREGFENETLRKSEVIKLYQKSLLHPAMYEITQVLIPIMRQVNLINEEILESSLKFLTTFSADTAVNRTSNYLVLEYLVDLGGQLPDFEPRYLSYLNEETFLAFVRQSDTPAKDTEVARPPVSWADSRRWQIAYPRWSLYERLSETQQKIWLRTYLLKAPQTDLPVQWSVALFALQSYRRLVNLEPTDLFAIGRAFRKFRNSPDLEYLTDRAAALFGEAWLKVFDHQDKLDLLRASTDLTELTEIAAEIFVVQANHWLSLGGLEYAARVELMPMISLDHLHKIWLKTEAEWKNFWDGYLELLGINGLSVIPPEPNLNARPSPNFHTINRNFTEPVSLLRFMFLTPAPTVEDIEFNNLWHQIFSNAAKKLPSSYAKILAQMDATTQNRVACWLKTQN